MTDEPVEALGSTASPRWRPLLVAFVVAGWLLVQILVPAVRLVQRGGGERPRTFGWQMFSHDLEEPAETFTVVTADGERPVRIDGFVDGPMRREVVYGPAVAAELCADRAVLAVRVRDAERGVWEVPCR